MLYFFFNLIGPFFTHINKKNCLKYVFQQNLYVGWDSTVSTLICYTLDSPGIELWWGVKFSASIQTNPRAHPASCTMVIGSLS